MKELESVSLTLWTLPPLHLAEVIAHDLSLSKSHSDLYRLRYVVLALTALQLVCSAEHPTLHFTLHPSIYLWFYVFLCCIVTVQLLDRLFFLCFQDSEDLL